MIGRILQGNFEILDKIGQGGMAVVYRARQISLDRVVAIKVLSGALVDLPGVRERFEQEAKIIARLTHPNIVQVHDVCEIDDEEGNLGIIMEYIDGRSLQQVLNDQRPLRIDRAMAIAEQTASGLAYAHAQGVVHRDIKPQNIMLTGDDHVKIMDFGIARLHGSSIRTMTGATMGTPEYMSPEQAAGEPVDHRSDLYSLAVVLYIMVTGELPFSGGSPATIGLKHIRETPRSPRGMNPAVTPEIEAAILKGMAKRPSDRYSSADDFRQTLINSAPTTSMEDSLGNGHTVITRTVPTPAAEPPVPDTRAAVPGETAPGRRIPAQVVESVAPLLRHHPRWIAAGAGGLLICLVVLVFHLFPGNGKPGAVKQDDRSGLPPVVHATPPGGSGSPEGPLSPPREVELLMRRLNESVAADPNRARRAFETAQTAARRLRETSGAVSDELLLQCLTGFVEAILYDPDNWRHPVEFARFVVETSERWNLPQPVRDGLLRDARELLRRASDRCTDSAERGNMATLDQEIVRRLLVSVPPSPSR